MLRIEDLIFSLRRMRLKGNRAPTSRQIEAINQLGLGSSPADMTLTEASAILTARSAAREVLHQIGSEARSPRAIRLQLEPYVIYTILQNRSVVFELLARNRKRLKFCQTGEPGPSHASRSFVFGETERLITGAPYANHSVIRPSKSGQPRPLRVHKRPNTSNPRIRPVRRSFSIIRFITAKIFGWSSNKPNISENSYEDQPILEPESSEILRGKASVIDGDTLEIHGKRIRIWGIDAPEGGQFGIKNGKPWRCGHDCAVALADFLGSQPVKCFQMGVDEFDRCVARCEVDGRDVGAWMVRNGWAIDYQQFSKGHYAGEQAEAKQSGRGLWASEFELPWKWRVRSKWLLENVSRKSS